MDHRPAPALHGSRTVRILLWIAGSISLALGLIGVVQAVLLVTAAAGVGVVFRIPTRNP